jgi:tetratricopeptide (TPR) repeat protein
MNAVLQFRAAATATTHALEALLDELASQTEGRVVAADLSLGSWTAHALGTQLLSQLMGKELRPGRWRPGNNDTPGRSSPSIDEEGRGTAPVRMAHALFVRIRRAIGDRATSALVLVPCFHHEWRTEDRLLLEYLQTCCPMLHITLASIDPATASWPAEWRPDFLPAKSEISARPTNGRTAESGLALLPGTLSPRHCTCLGGSAALNLIRLPSGWALIAPEDRAALTRQHYRFQTDDLERLESIGLAEFIPYALVHGARLRNAAVLLRDEAWVQFAAGGRNLAIQLMDAAANCFQDEPSRASILAVRKMMLVSMARYSEAAAAAPFSMEELPARERRLLLEWQGWGLVMNGRAQEARACLTEALRLEDPAREDAEHLFLMNITALSELRCGNHERAYELEKQIEAVLASQQYPDEGVVFINSINLARLCRYSRNWDDSAHYYRRAFATAEGAPSDTDRVNEQLCLARLAEDQEHWFQAFDSTFRASLYWLAGDCPEALNWRVQSLLLGNRALKIASHLGELYECVEQLALAFTTTLQRLGKAAGLDEPEPFCGAAVHFRFHDDDSPTSDRMMYLGGPHWAVVADESSQAGRGYGPHFEALKQYVATRIARFHDRSEVNTLRIARNDGRPMPITEDAMLHQAASLGLRSIHLGGNRFIQLPSREPESWQFLKRSHLVQRSQTDREDVTVFFRRYLAPCRLTPNEAAIYREITDLVAFEDICIRARSLGLQPGDVKQTVRSLRKKSILTVARSLDSVPPVSVSGLIGPGPTISYAKSAY